MTDQVKQINRELNNGKPIKPAKLIQLLKELKTLGYYK